MHENLFTKDVLTISVDSISTYWFKTLYHMLKQKCEIQNQKPKQMTPLIPVSIRSSADAVCGLMPRNVVKAYGPKSPVH